jgi:hypothetical protein
VAKVRGTMKEVPEIEVNIDTVYIRSNITKIEEEDFIGWEYDEEQYDKDEFIELISKENDRLKRDNINNMKAMVELHTKILALEGKL